MKMVNRLTTFIPRGGIGTVMLLFGALCTAWAGPAITRSYYLPITEDEAHLHYASLNLTPGYDDYIVNVISISPSVSNTVIYYDQWEDGFEVDLANPVQSSTQVWGDNNPGNGAWPRPRSPEQHRCV